MQQLRMTRKVANNFYYFLVLICSFVWVASAIDGFDSSYEQPKEINLGLLEDTCSPETELFAIEEVEEGVSITFWSNAEPTEYFSSSIITYTCLPSPCEWIGLNSPPPEYSSSNSL